MDNMTYLINTDKRPFLYSEVEDFSPRIIINSTYDECILMLSKFIRTIADKKEISCNEILEDINSVNLLNNIIFKVINEGE